MFKCDVYLLNDRLIMIENVLFHHRAAPGVAFVPDSINMTSACFLFGSNSAQQNFVVDINQKITLIGSDQQIVIFLLTLIVYNLFNPVIDTGSN